MFKVDLCVCVCVSDATKYMFYTSNASLFCLNEVVKGMFLKQMKYPIHFLAGVQEKSFCYRHNCHSVAVVTPFEVVTSYHFCLSFNWF